VLSCDSGGGNNMYEIAGCTDENACNFNSDAVILDNSCIYDQPEIFMDTGVDGEYWQAASCPILDYGEGNGIWDGPIIMIDPCSITEDTPHGVLVHYPGENYFDSNEDNQYTPSSCPYSNVTCNSNFVTINNSTYYCQDLKFLEDLINNNPNIDFNYNPFNVNTTEEILNLGSQQWINGRLSYLAINCDLFGTIFGCSDIINIPNSIENLSELNSLYLSGLSITTLPENIGSLTSLYTLDLANNSLQELPSSITNLNNLHYLNLSNNQLVELPENIGNLMNLSYLDLSDNTLQELPLSITNLSNLYFLDLTDNNLITLPDISNLPICLYTPVHHIAGIFIENNKLCAEYYSIYPGLSGLYSPDDWYETQDQSNCCEGMNDGGQTIENWRQCEEYETYGKNEWSLARWFKYYFNPIGYNASDINYWFTHIDSDGNGIAEEIPFRTPWDFSHEIHYYYNGNIVSTNGNMGRDSYLEICNTSEENNYICNATLEEIEEQIGYVTYNNDFFENIGKYNTFFAGWNDNESAWLETVEGLTIYTPLKSYYVNTLYPY